ncbi:MAG: methyltransferase domain-containing protein [Bryobacteraceae bacterium]
MSESGKPFGDRYVLAAGRSGHDRLRMLCRIHDPYTRQWLTRAGLGPGHRFVEFGCGLGFVSRWAASQGAQVTAVDLSAEHLEQARQMAEAENLTSISFENRNIYDHGLPEESFDFAYTRWILVHLARPVEALRKIASALKPGGVLVCEEAEVSQVYAEPRGESYRAYVEMVLEVGRHRGVNYEGGRVLHTWAAEAGFAVEAVSAYQPHYMEGEEKGFWSWTFEESGASLVNEGVLSQEKLDELVSGMRAADADPGVVVGHCRTHQIIARKRP